MKNSI